MKWRYKYKTLNALTRAKKCGRAACKAGQGRDTCIYAGRSGLSLLLANAWYAGYDSQDGKPENKRPITAR